MTYLELVQRLHSEAKVAGSSPTTVVGQTGMVARLVNWVLTAYEDIQNLHPQGWKFLQAPFSFTTTISKRNYALSDLELTDLGTWKIGPGDVRIYKSATDENELIYEPWDTYRLAYITGSARTQEGRPSVFSIKYDNSMDLWQIPNGEYTVNGEHFMKAQTMNADEDEPLIPSQYQMIIVWRALMFFGAVMGANDKYEHGQNEYKRILRRLEMNQLPRFTWGPPLA